MTRLINLDDEIIVLYANETKAQVFTEENNGEDFQKEAMNFFNNMMLEEQELGIRIDEPTKKELLQEKLQEERMDDLKAEYEQEQETIEDEDYE